MSLFITLRTSGGIKLLRDVDSFVPFPQIIPSGSAPVNSAPPSISGTGYIGEALTINAGSWSDMIAGAGNSTVARTLLRNGVPVAYGVSGGDIYIPAPGDDRASFTVQEIATSGSYTSAPVTSAPRGITYRPPTNGVGIGNQIFAQGTGPHTLDAAAIFTGQNLLWSIAGPAGIEIDEGIVTFPTANAMAATDVTVTATNSGGSASATFTLTVTDAAPVSSGVALPDQSYPQNSGTRLFDVSVGFTGSNMTFSLVSPPAGVSVSSSGTLSTNTANLLSSSAVTVRASNGGGYLDRTINVAVVVATGQPPTLTGAALADQLNLIRGTGTSTFSAIQAFAGTITSWAITGSGVSISSSGTVSMAKTATQAQQTCTVTASNTYGSVSTTFRMSVIMKVIDPSWVTPSWRKDPTGQSNPSATPTSVPADFFTWQFDLDESKIPETINVLGWSPDADTAGKGMGSGFHMCVRHPTIFGRWIARRCNPTTGATEISSWLDVVGSGVVGQSRTHHFIWSASPVAADLRTLEYSGQSAALVAIIALTGAPAFTVSPQIGRNRTCTISNASPSVVTLNAHSQSNGDVVRFSTTGTLPSPLAAATDYYVINKATNTFQVSATSGGTAIATTAAGSGTHTLITPATTAAVGTVLSVIDGKVTGDPVPTITRRLLLGTTAKAEPYTIVAGDAGVFTAENTATSTGGVVKSTSAAITVGETIFATIGSIAELDTAITNCPGGRVILCKPGVYWGRINRVGNVNKSPNIIIRAQDYANPPEFRGSNYTATSNTDDAYQGPFNFETCSGITLDGLYCFNDRRDWRNGPGRSEDFAYDLKPKDPRQPAAAGNWGPFAIRFYNGCSNVKVTDCLIEGYPGAIYFQADTKGGTTNGEICYNTIRKSTIDHIRIYGQLTNVSVHHNKAFDCAIPANNPSNTWQVDPNRHRDFCQMASGQSLTVDFYDNWFRCEFDSNMHGPFAFAERIFNSGLDFDTYSHKKVSVLRNYLEGCSFQCITVGGVDDMTVSGNLIQLGESTDDPEIYFLAPTAANPSAKAGNNIKISNNVVPLRSGQSVIRYGPGGTTPGGAGSTAIATNVTISAQIAAPHVKKHTLKPVGWDGWDASTVGKTGVTERVGRLAAR